MKVLFGIRHDGADSYFRAIAPASVLRWQGVECDARAVALEDADDYDILVLQRHCSLAGELALRAFQDKGKKVIYDVDDWLFGIPPFWPAYDQYFVRGTLQPTELLIMHERMLVQADMVTCTTGELAKKLSVYNENIAVLPNCVMWADWDTVLPAQQMTDGPVIGWFGMPYYWDTWRDIAPFVERAMLDCNAHLCILGFPEIVQCFSDWMREHTFVQPACTWRDFAKMRQLIQTFDVGLARVNDTPFNRCKSPLRAIPYGAAGVPILASRTVYESVLGDSGMPMTLNESSITGALTVMLMDENRADFGARAEAWQQHVWQHHTYETQWPCWLDVFEELLDA